MDFLWLIIGLALILIGANALTDGAASVAKRFHISPLVIGLTIVAFGTSAPELTVSVVSALKGSAGLAIGNVIGSNIFNCLMIVGCTAAIVPKQNSKGSYTKDNTQTRLAAIVLFVCANDQLINGLSANSMSRSEGLLLLCFFAIFMGYTFAIAHNGQAEDTAIPTLSVGRSTLYIIGGLAGLIYGGQCFVDGASGIARSLGVSESVIGLTLVAGGTSLPELATSVVAALKKNPEMAVGNVIGSNLFNVFFVLGCSASITAIPVQGISSLDLGMHIAACLLLFIFGLFFRQRTITRIEGIALVACYIGYTTYLILQ